MLVSLTFFELLFSCSSSSASTLNITLKSGAPSSHNTNLQYVSKCCFLN